MRKLALFPLVITLLVACSDAGSGSVNEPVDAGKNWLAEEGDKWQLYVPPELGYGEKGSGPIPGNTVLVFEVELIEVKAG